jgi:hypothetical protein
MKNGKSYFARAFLHVPGQSDQLQMNKGLLGAGFFLGLLVMSVLFAWTALVLPLNISWVALTLSALAVVSYFAMKHCESYVDRYWQGQEGEKFVSDEIEPLIRSGYHIFNDVPGDKFNVDFLVIGPSGIYVIEVKNPRKFKSDKVRYQSGRIFIGNNCLTKTDPVGQVLANSNWAKRLLENGANHKIEGIMPVLLFPNMMVEEYTQDLWVLNPKRFVSEHIPKRTKILSPESVQTLASMIRMHIQAKNGSPED